ncbi:MAG: ABC transporter permease [Syntrophobacteraceae bacterium]|jgi:simple sugar transport system permease protein
MSQLLNLIALTLVKASPLLLAAFGGLLSELSGVINFALEGMMLSGAFAAVLGTWATGSSWVGLLCAMFSGAFIGAVHAGACLKFRANQIVSAIAVNLLAAGLTGFFLNQIFHVYGTSPGVEALPNLGSILPPAGAPSNLRRLAEGVSILVPAALAIGVALTAFLRWTVPGLRLRACGENPDGARAAGLMVSHIQFFAVCAGGALAGMAGAFLSIGVLSQFVENMTQGRGYLAVAAVILGRWRPLGVMLAVLFFGFAEALSEWLAVRWSALPNQLFLVLPYVACFAILVFYSGRRSPPSALGRIG